TKEEVDAFFEGSKNVLYGVMDNGVLAAVSGLLFDLDDFTEEFKLLQIRPEEVGEIGGSMTLPVYRNKGYMSAINKELMGVAGQMGLKYIVATAHPDNVASNKSLQKLGMQKIKEFCRHGEYVRSLYIYKIEDQL
ncbi:MAG: GNAT family N-acetyltransferase, partial [Tannerellaceae bacterium]|nr:GNAT family N-acetyltransferase [Tannerellaceae bacterium]